MAADYPKVSYTTPGIEFKGDHFTFDIAQAVGAYVEAVIFTPQPSSFVPKFFTRTEQQPIYEDVFKSKETKMAKVTCDKPIIIDGVKGLLRSYDATQQNKIKVKPFTVTDCHGKHIENVVALSVTVNKAINSGAIQNPLTKSSFKMLFIPFSESSQSGGAGAAKKKQHVTLNGSTRKYVVRMDGRKKYIQKDKQRVYLSTLKGKYRAC